MAQTPKTFVRMALTRAIQTIWTAPQNITADLVTDIQLSNNTRLQTPSAPTISQVGATGTTSHTYYIVAVDAWGGKTLVSPSGTTTTSNATLSATNYNVITWTPVPGAVSYDILKDSLTTSLVTGTAGTVSGNNLTYNDQGTGTSAYTTPTINNSGVRSFVTIHHVPSGGSPTLSNRIATMYEVDPGIPADLQFNLVMASGDTLQATVFAGQNNDTSIDNNVTMGVIGVEYS